MGESVVPHVAAWRRDRLPSLPATGAIDVVPDWACEVIRREVAQWITRMDLYRRAGVAWLWRVFADDGVLESFENIGPHWRMEGVHGDDVARIAPFTAIAFECDRMFGRLPLALR